MGIWPARDIARRIDAGDARLEILIDDDPIIDCEPRVFGQPRSGRTPMPATTRSAARRLPIFSITASFSIADTDVPRWNITPCSSWMLLTMSPSSGPRTRSSGRDLRPDDVNLDAPRAQRCCRFEADKACADDDDPLCTRGFGDQIATIVERAQIMDVWQVGARNIQVHGIGSGRDQKRIECDAAAVRQRDGPFDGIDRRDARAQPHVDLLLRVKIRRAQRNPVF